MTENPTESVTAVAVGWLSYYLALFHHKPVSTVSMYRISSMRLRCCMRPPIHTDHGVGRRAIAITLLAWNIGSAPSGAMPPPRTATPRPAPRPRNAESRSPSMSI